MKISKVLTSMALLGGLALSSATMAETGNITASLKAVDVMHDGKPITITRTADKKATLPKPYTPVGRHCPPFCIQPMTIGTGIETVGELEVLGYLKRISTGDRKIMVVDSRTPEWAARGTIPGSVNIPWNKINVDMAGAFDVEAGADSLADTLTQQFGAVLRDGQWDFRNAKTLVMFCNGIWCPQSTINIKTLANMGYPAYKLKWYRGGVQSWLSVGLTTIKP